MEEISNDDLVELALIAHRTCAAANIAADIAREQDRKIKQEIRRRVGPEGGLIITDSGTAVISCQGQPITKLNKRAIIDEFGIDFLNSRDLVKFREPYAQRVKLYDADEILCDGE